MFDFRWRAAGCKRDREFIYNDAETRKDSVERQVCPISWGGQPEREFFEKLTQCDVTVASAAPPFFVFPCQ